MASRDSADTPAPVQATETFAAEHDGRVFYVRTGDRLAPSHPIVNAHPSRFDHNVVESK